MRFFRFMGEARISSPPRVITTAALVAAGAIDKPPTSTRDLRAVQDAFNTWAAESGRDLTNLSRVLALGTRPEGWGRRQLRAPERSPASNCLCGG